MEEETPSLADALPRARALAAQQRRLWEGEAARERFGSPRPAGCKLSLHRRAIDASVAHVLFNEIATTVVWRREVDAFGEQKRETYYCGEAGCVFTYAGLTLTPNPWPQPVLRARALVADVLGLPLSSLSACLLNNYPAGCGSIPWHHDEVRAHGAARTVATLSLGAAREFRLRRKGGAEGAEESVLLEAGDVLLMAGDTQEHYEHALPSMPFDGHRISLTFRSIESGAEEPAARGGRFVVAPSPLLALMSAARAALERWLGAALCSWFEEVCDEVAPWLKWKVYDAIFALCLRRLGLGEWITD